MNPQENQDLERKIQQLEAEIEQVPSSPTVETEAGLPIQMTTKEYPTVKSLLNRVTNWFNGLPGVGKILAIAVAAVVGFAILRSVLYLTASLISLGILAGIVYLVYKFFIAPKSAE